MLGKALKLGGIILMALAFDRSAHSLTYPTATLTITGTEQPVSGGWDSGTITISFNGHQHSVSYGQFSTASSIASAFAAEFSSYPASAWPQLCTVGVCAKANGATITFQLNGPGPFTSPVITGPTTSFTVNGSAWPSMPVITWPTPSPITYGTPLTATQLDAAAVTPGTGASVVGTFSYSPAVGTVLSASSQTLQVTFTPTDPSAFMQATSSVTLTVNQATPTISISDIPFGVKTGGSFAVTYSYSGSGSPTESVSSSTPGVCTVSGNLVSFVGVGTCTLQASATATTDYTATTGSAQSFRVNATSQIGLPSPGIINTIAGNGTYGYSGDGGPATSAQLFEPFGVAVDGAGNVYIADVRNSNIRMVTASTGVISTVVTGFGVSGIALDSAGNIYYADSDNMIFMMNPSTGAFSVVAGNGAGGYLGGYSGDGGLATNAELSDPLGVAVDSAGNVYIADRSNQRIRMVTASTGIISTIAGIGGAGGYSGDGGPATSAALNYPTGVAVDSAGNVYIADQLNNRIRKVTASTGIISTVVGNGTAGYSGDGIPATSAKLNIPIGVAVDSAGNIYISDEGDNRIRMVTAFTGIISTIAGNGTQGYSGDGGAATGAELNFSTGVAVDLAGNIYFADSSNFVVRAVGALPPASNVSISCAPGAITYGNSTTCTATVTGSSPTGAVTFTYNGNPWTNCPLSGGSCSVSGLSSVGGGFYNIVGNYSGDGYNAAASGSTSLTIYEATTGNDPATPTISISDIPLSAKNGGSFTVSYSYSGDGSPTESVLSSTPGVCVVSGNLVSFVSVGTCTLQASATATTDYTAATGSVQSFTVSAVTQQIALPPMGYIDTIAGDGTYGYSGDGGAAISAELNIPYGVSVDSAGNVYIVDQGNSRIRKVTASTGVISTIAGDGIDGYSGDGGAATNAEFSGIGGVAADNAGNIYIADSINNRIRKVTASTGMITTVAGNGTAGYSGDGGAATSAELWHPMAVAVDSAGNIYIADSISALIRKVAASTGIITTVAGNAAVDYFGDGGTYSGDGGPATSAELWYPDGVAVDSAGNVYIADEGNRRIRKVTASTGIITTVAGNGTSGYSGDGGPAISAELAVPEGVSVDSAGNVYITDNDRIRMVTVSTGIISTIAGNGTVGYSGDGGLAINAELHGPAGVAVDATGNIYIADTGNAAIRAVGGFLPAAGVSISCTPNIIIQGSSTTCTATVTGSSPTGAVTFSYNGILWASCTLSSGSCSVSGLNGVLAGFYAIAGGYSGDGNNAAASGSTGLTISRITPTISVASSGSPSTYGQPVTFTATVTIDDTNPVSFYSEGILLGTATPSNGTATLTTSSLPIGTYLVMASIAAGESYNGAAFSGITQTVNGSGQPDTGTVTLQVNGSAIAQTTYGAGSTPSSIAENLAAAASGSLVNVSAVNNTLYVESTASGTGSAYPYSVVISDTAGFSTPSFSASPSSGNLQGTTGGGSGQTIYSYCVSGPSNTCSPANSGYDPAGNLLGYSDSVMGTWNFGYDGLNRLLSGIPAAGNNSNNGLSLCWSYDSFGNRTSESSQAGACPTLPSVPTATATYNTNNQVTWTSVNGAANGFKYDGAGDVTDDNRNKYLYDAEGRICAVVNYPYGGVVVMTGYLYDADGTRVAKGTITSMSCDPAVNGFQTTSDYVLGLAGEQVTEMGVDANGNLAHQHTNAWAGGKLLGTYDDDGLHFYLDDPLGTRRVQTDYAGVIEQQCASLPYGDGESCSATPTEHLFTGKERDTESGLDYFGARYYASSMGRFMSPDWSAKYEPVPYAKLDNPQTLNLYSYVQNNPLSNRDLDGHESDADKDKKLPKPDAQHDHTVTVRQVEGQNGNPFGHATVQVDGGKEVGYGPKTDMTKKEIVENKAVPGQVEPRADGVKTLDAVTIHVTADQAKAAQQTIDDVTKNPGSYVLRGSDVNNCATFDQRVVNAAGGNAPHDTTPGGIVGDIRNQQYKDNSVQTPTPH